MIRKIILYTVLLIIFSNVLLPTSQGEKFVNFIEGRLPPWERGDLLIENGTYYFKSFYDLENYTNITIINATVFIKKSVEGGVESLKIINSTLVVEEIVKNGSLPEFSLLYPYYLHLKYLYIMSSNISGLIADVEYGPKEGYIWNSTLTLCDLMIGGKDISIQNTTFFKSKILLSPFNSSITNCTFQDVNLFLYLSITNISLPLENLSDTFHLYFKDNTIIFTNEPTNYTKGVFINLWVWYDKDFEKASLYIENNTMYSSPNNSFMEIYVSGISPYNFKNRGGRIPWTLENLTDYSFKNNKNMEIRIYYDCEIEVKDANTHQLLKNVDIEIIPLNKTNFQQVRLIDNKTGGPWYTAWFTILTYYVDKNNSFIHYKTYKVIVKKDGYYPFIGYINMPNDIYKVILMYRIITWKDYLPYIISTTIIIIVILYIAIRRKLKTQKWK